MEYLQCAVDNLVMARSAFSKKIMREFKAAYEDTQKSTQRFSLLSLRDKFPEPWSAISNAWQRATKSGKHAVNGKSVFVFVHGRPPKCWNCGEPSLRCLQTDRPEDFGARACSIRCANEAKRLKLKEVMLDKHGVENIFSSEEFRENRTKYLQDKHGKHVTGPLLVPGALDKVARTSVERYGVSHFSQSDIVKDKKVATNMERFGAVCFYASAKSRSRLSAAMMSRYGVDHQSKAPSVKKQKTVKSLEKFGTSSPTQHHSVKAKYRSTMIERYGVENPLQSPSIFYKQVSNSFRIKEIIWRNKTLSVQGYEPIVLKSVEKDKRIKDARVPDYAVAYSYKGKERRYHPDLVLYGKDEAWLVEVKSVWTLLHNGCYQQNLQKFKSAQRFAAARGGRFVVALVHDGHVGWIYEPATALKSKVRRFLRSICAQQ